MTITLLNSIAIAEEGDHSRRNKPQKVVRKKA